MAIKFNSIRFYLISRKWKLPRLLYALMIIELAASIAALALMGIASPNLYRTKMWRVGADNGFNSSPTQILYAYANYRPIPKTPWVWSQSITDFNEAIAILCTFLLITKCALFMLHLWFPLLGTVVNLVITALWIVSAVGQAGPDHSDPAHPSNTAWYINHSCNYAKSSQYDWSNYCKQAKATFAITIFMIIIFALNVALGIYSLIPTAAMRLAASTEIDDLAQVEGKNHNHSPVSDDSGLGRRDKNWEMSRLTAFRQPPLSAQPYTPRTLAFNTLERKLPFRDA